jgi:hypothetical protein
MMPTTRILAKNGGRLGERPQQSLIAEFVRVDSVRADILCCQTYQSIDPLLDDESAVKFELQIKIVIVVV